MVAAYDRSWLNADVIAGLTVWGLIVPQSMAFAGVAGLPPQFGLYTLVASLLLYAVLGTSRHLIVQSTSATAALIASSVTAVLVTAGIVANGAEIDPVVYQQYALAFTVVVGPGISDRRCGSPWFYHAVSLQTGVGWLCDRAGHIRHGWAALQAVWCAKTGRQHGAEVLVSTLVFLTPLFTNLPETILAALIINALWHTVAARKLRTARLESRPEFILGLLTFAGVIFIGVLQGVLIGVVFSLLLLILRSSRAHLSQLGKTSADSGVYSDVTWHPENVLVPGVIILRLNSPIYYANALTVRDKIVDMIKASDQPVTAAILDATVQYALDITSSNMLKSLVKRLSNQGIAVYFAEVQDPVLEFSANTGLLDVVGADHLFSTVDAAIRHIEADLGRAV